MAAMRAPIDLDSRRADRRTALRDAAMEGTALVAELGAAVANLDAAIASRSWDAAFRIRHRLGWLADTYRDEFRRLSGGDAA